MIQGIAQMSMELQTDELYTAYSLALAKKAMEIPEASAEALLAEMLPESVPIPQQLPPVSVEPHLIDTYA